MLETLIVPACFLVAGLVGRRLGTPARVAGGLVALGCAHLLALLTARQALVAGGALADGMHLLSQLLFVGGFVALVWLAAVYPDRTAPVRLVGTAAAVAVAGPLLAAVSGPTPAVLEDARELGPLVSLLPERVAGLAVVPVLLLPLLAVVVFAVRYGRADRDARAVLRWPVVALAVIAALVAAGTLLGQSHQAIVTGLFLLAAPVFPLAVAFGPVARRTDLLSSDLAQARGRSRHRVWPAAPPGVLARLTPRELTVLEAMADGKSNPEIAKSLHLSLSSIEKHATAIFRKLEIVDAATTHRRVSAVVAYRDAVEGARGDARSA